MIEPIFGAKECTRMQDFVLKYTKKNRGVATSGPRGGRGYICSQLPPWLPARCWCPSASSRLATSVRQVNIAFFKLVLISPCRFSTVVCTRCAPRIYVHNAIFFYRGTLKKFRRFSSEFVPPNFKTVSAPMVVSLVVSAIDPTVASLSAAYLFLL